jgi:lysyl-tRNA synthetase class 1
VIEREIPFVKNWLEKYAPASVKFAVQPRLPEVELSNDQNQFMSDLAGRIVGMELDGQGMHEAIYEAKDAVGLTPHDAFQALYRVILGQDRGPKAGWFLASLDQSWLVKRLRLEA